MFICFESLGTVGDVAPLIAVARELQRRGHTCELLTNECFVADAHRDSITLPDGTVLLMLPLTATPPESATPAGQDSNTTFKASSLFTGGLGSFSR